MNHNSSRTSVGLFVIRTVLAVLVLSVVVMPLAGQCYNQPGWVHYGCSTYPLTQSSTPTNTDVQVANLVYDPAKAWADYSWILSTPTDSAAAATALSTGVKTYNNSINMSNSASPIPTLCEQAKTTYNKAVGTITSVQWSHATPASLSNAHEASRNSYSAIANDILDGAVMDVMMGCGNPDYNASGKPTSAKDYNYVGGEAAWTSLIAATHAGGWTLLQTREQVRALASGATPQRVLVTAQVRGTLQQGRRVSRDWDANGKIDKEDIKVADVCGDPMIETVPTLAEMTRAALNCLTSRDQAGANGFVLNIEGGAVDSAAHSNQLPRMVEEQLAFVEAVQAVVDFVDADGDEYTWENTLLVITSDHDTGLMWGPNSGSANFEPLVAQGPHKAPLTHYNSGGHSNSLVPLMARGAGSERFAALVDGNDPTAAAKWGVGDYVDNTDVYTVMSAAIADGHNVVLMVADGGGFNNWKAAQMYAAPEPAALSQPDSGGARVTAAPAPH